MATQTVGQTDLRNENIERAVKGFALKLFKMKQVLTLSSSSSWKETFFAEGASDLTASGTRNIRGVSRGANLPFVEPNWEEKSVRHQKYAAQGVIFMEDILTDSIDVQARTLLRVARAIANSVDIAIYDGLSDATGINTGSTNAAWDDTTITDRQPIDDILAGIQAIDEDNYDALANGFLLVSPKDHRSLIGNSKVINNPSFKTADVVSNGKVGQIAGLTIIKSTTVSDDEAMIIVGQRAATWKSALGLKTETIIDPLIKTTIRAAEIGVLQVTDPKAIYVITGTQA